MVISDVTPIKIDSYFDTIYFTFRKDRKKYHEVIKTFKPYYYTSDIDKPIIPIKDCIKRYPTKIYNMKKEAQEFSYSFQGDLNLKRSFAIEHFKGIDIQREEIKTVVLDIENLVDGKISLEGNLSVTAISLYDIEKDCIFTFSWHEIVQYKDKENKIIVFKTEEEMLNTFVEFFRANDYDLITGWNVDYDISYLCNRLKKFNLLNKISPFDRVVNEFKDENKFWIFGISVVDYLGLYKTYAYKELPSYSLNSVAEVEGIEKKVKYNGSLNDLWKNDIKTFLDYNRHDVRIVKLIEDKKKYLILLDEVRRLGAANFEDSQQNSIIIDNILIKLLNHKGFTVKTKKINEEHEKIEGAFVKEPKPGIYDWVIDGDFTSLYPFIIMNLNISPESKVGKVLNWNEIENLIDINYKISVNNIYKEFNSDEFRQFMVENQYAMAGNGVIFNKHKGVFPLILEWLFKQRKEYKNKMLEAKKNKDEKNVIIYNSKQLVMKILLNSFYGCMGLASGRFFDPDLASAVTLTGQKLIKHSAKIAEENGYEVITSDTDSILATYTDIQNVNDAIIKSKEMSDNVTKSLENFCNNEFFIQNNTFKMKEEMIARRGMFFAKKRYCLWKIFQEGVEVDEMEFKGVEIVRNSTPKFAKKHLIKIFESALKENDKEKVYKLIEDFKNEFKDADSNEIGIRMTMTKKFEDYKKNLPIHVRGCKLWEEFFSKGSKSFNDESKGRYYFLKEFDKLKLNEKEMKALKKKGIVLSVPDEVDFPLDKSIIDYDRMEERIINKPLKQLIAIFEGGIIEDEEEIE